MKFKDQLEKLDACGTAIDWVGKRDAKAAWAKCKNGNWMLWLINKTTKKVTLAQRKKLVLCACEIAEMVLKYVPKSEMQPAEAIRLAQAWANGEMVTLKQVDDAANAAYAAYADIVRKYFPKPPKIGK